MARREGFVGERSSPWPANWRLAATPDPSGSKPDALGRLADHARVQFPSQQKTPGSRSFRAFLLRMAKVVAGEGFEPPTSVI